MQRYNPKSIEPKWQKTWESDKLYEASEDPASPKRYVLEYFPYPSGAAMHVGHVRNYTIGDVIARFNRMHGFNVLHPMGWDAFGLPAENYAIKNKVSPRVAIDENTARFKRQLMQMGFGYDWSREIDSTDPKYYKWTQWFFLMLFNKGLAYQQEALVNWDPVDKTVLANEQVIDGRAERSGALVEKKSLKQWFFKITDYADRLLDDLDNLDWSESIKSMQRNWIGRSEGITVEFETEGHTEKIEVFTTAHDTIFGVTFMVLAPEHALVQKIATDEHRANVNSYIKSTQGKSEIERQDEGRPKTGVFTGAHVINPINGARVPVWIADYVLAGYGTGAVMAVPGEDKRDYEFAQKYELPIVFTTEQQEFVNYQTKLKKNRKNYKLANSGEFNGLDFEIGRQKILDKLIELKIGKVEINYKMRDWLISRQRYWGAPIPIIHCPIDGAVPVPADQLPVVLPEVESYEPSGDGRSPLANVPEFVNTTCPKCGGPAERETDTMDGFACSSWYFLRFADPHNDELPFTRDKADFWLPVDDYIGGAEHAIMHLLYARFWTKVMYDEKLINFEEPFTTLRNQGMILAPNGLKMSKSKNNTIEPDEIIEQGYGADSIRIMELFIGPWNQTANWSVEGMGGAFRFLQRIWTLTQEYQEAEGQDGVHQSHEQAILKAAHYTIRSVTEDLKQLGFNTAIATLMEYVNNLYKLKTQDDFANNEAWNFAITSLLQLVAPFAPHIAEELWAQTGHTGSIHTSEWPVYDEALLIEETLTVVIQVNGKLRGEISVTRGADEASVVAAAKADQKVARYLESQTIRKTVYVDGKLVNFVI
ncbi:MAG TPA: leucine--tRNA ligase [Candidatus Dormibacteraeota bacterium]|nr:leucine--tRNA ligase [Candidatus Dormibacteraeota bacterium]